MPKTTLIGVPANSLPDVWTQIGPMVEQAVNTSNGKYIASDIARMIVRGEMQLWAAVSEGKIEAIAIGQIVNYPRLRVYKMLCATGEDMAEWVDHIKAIENWAKVQGCGDFEAITRPGWAKILKGDGYRHTHSVLNKNLLIDGIIQ